jgi:quercetin dioxygenase-like cupin family protein
MKNFELSALLKQAAAQDARYLEFLRAPSMSLGIYTLAAGSVDMQSPHTQDEVYYVLAGKAKLQVENEVQAVQSGSIVFVAAHDKHKFIEIEEDLTILVFFAPAEED